MSEEVEAKNIKVTLLSNGLTVIAIEETIEGVDTWIKPQLVIEQRDPSDPRKTIMNLIPFFTYSNNLDGLKPNSIHILSEYEPSDGLLQGYQQYLDQLDKEPSRIITANKDIFLPDSMSH